MRVCLSLAALAILLSASTSPASTIIVEHVGSADPTTEGWTVSAGSPDATGGGTEVTGSGSHDFWQIDHTLGDSPAASASYLPTATQLDFDWRLEASVRVIDSPPHCCFVAPMPFTMLFVRDGLDTWNFLLGNDVVGVLDDAAAPFSNFARSASVDTRTDYHDYVIQFRRNGPGTADDTADFYYDGTLLFDDVTRAEIQSIASTSVSWGPAARDQTSIANYERVAFISVPEPAPTWLAALGLAALAAWRRDRGGPPGRR